MTLVAEQPSAAAERRQRALASYIEALRAPRAVSAAGGGAWPAADPWVAGRIRAFFGGDTRATGIPALVVQGAALLAKCAKDAAALEPAARSGSEALFAAEAELMLDLGLGVALLRELQHAVDDAVRQGGAREAKDLARFYHEVRKNVAGVRKKIAQTEQRRAEALSDQLTDRPKQADAPQSDSRMQRLAQDAAVAHERARAGKRRERALLAAVALPSRTETLVALLAIAVALWLATVSLPRLLDTPPRIVTLEDLSLAEGIQEVEALPPSLYAVVDPTAWAAMPEAARNRAVGTVSSTLLAYGYTGARFSTPEGRTVAQWLAGRGVELLDTREIPPADPRHAFTHVRQAGGRDAEAAAEAPSADATDAAGPDAPASD